MLLLIFNCGSCFWTTTTTNNEEVGANDDEETPTAPSMFDSPVVTGIVDLEQGNAHTDNMSTDDDDDDVVSVTPGNDNDDERRGM